MAIRAVPSVLLSVAFVVVVPVFVWWTSFDLAKVTAHKAAEEAEHKLVRGEFSSGLPVFVRIFKLESELELWMQKDGAWRLLNTFPICAWSGRLGPKLKEGDGQSPEGFYRIRRGSLNPNSSYHLSFNLGFPNAYDRSLGRTGSFLMVHGNCVSIGCYAMTDPGIDVIYGLVEAALKGGQRGVPVHIFPFRMTDQNMTRHAHSKWIDFWHELKSGHDAFEANRIVPSISVQSQSYIVNTAVD